MWSKYKVFNAPFLKRKTYVRIDEILFGLQRNEKRPKKA